MALGSDRAQIGLIELTIPEGEEVYPSVTFETSRDVEMTTDQCDLHHPEATVAEMSIGGIEIGAVIDMMVEEVDHAHHLVVTNAIEAPVQGGETQMRISICYSRREL